MRLNPTWLAIAILAASGTWFIAGCAESPPTDTETAAEEPAAASEEHTHVRAVEASEDLAGGETHYGPDQIEMLGGVLSSGSEDTRAEALKILKHVLVNDARPDIRASAAHALGNAADRVVEQLLQAGMTDKAPEVREAAVEALGHGSPSARLYEQLSRLRRADDAIVRAAAFKGELTLRLNDPDRESGLRWLVNQLGERKDDASAQAAIRANLTGPAILPYAIEALENSDDPLQREVAACVISLVCAGTSPRQQEFAKLAKTGKTPGVLQPQPANLEGLEPLEKALSQDPSPEVRAIAAQGLGYLGQPGSAKVLGRALHDPDQSVRWWAASSLVTVRPDPAVEDLAQAVTQDESADVRRAAVRALAWVENKQTVVPPLLRATRDSSAEVRRVAAVELGRIADPKALEPLTSLFNDESEDVRWAAVVAAGNLEDPRAAPALADALRDRSPMVANAAERALQKMGIAERRFGTRDEM
jgi:HEAT repeat protein